MPEELRIGVFVCHCGLNIAGVIDVEELTEYARTLPNVVCAIRNRYTCADPGQEEIRKAIKEHKLNRVVVAACSPRMHEPTFRRCVAEAGLNPYLFEMANIREFSSWCHPSTPKEATEKAKDSVKMAVAKVRLFRPLKSMEVPVTNKALIIGCLLYTSPSPRDATLSRMPSSAPEEIELEVGTIITATGFDIYVPDDNSLYGYGRYDNVITALELERLILAAGPTGGKVVRASDGKKPKVVIFIQCVGSRDVNKYEYCSGFCCMYSLKHSIQLKEKYKDAVEVYILYMDMRTHFKGYEEFYRRARELGVNFIRGRAVHILENPETKNLTVRAEDMALGEPIELEAELVVLATAAIPTKGTDEMARILNVTRGADGFFMESHPKLKPIDTAVDGIFLAGACQGLKDIPYSVSQGSGAASRAATILSKPTWKIEPVIAVVDPDKCRNTRVKCGICARKCPYGAIKAPEGEPAEVTTAMCHGCGTCVAECPSDAITQMHFTDAQIFAQIRAALEENPEDKILGFLCNWCAYAGADLAGTSRFEYPPNLRAVRVMCSGRVDRDFVMEALRLGAGMVLVAGCHLPYDCHYISGNEAMKVRMEALARMLEKLGLSPERFKVEYISAAEGVKFADLIKEMTEQMKSLGKGKIKAENEKLQPMLEKMLSRKKA